ADSRAVVLFVYGVDCNIARDSIPALKQLRERFAEQDDGFLMKLDGFLMKLRERFAKQGDGLLMRVGKRFATWGRGFLMTSRERFANRSVSFLMIDANSQDDRQALQKDAARYGIDMPILKDESQLVAENLDIDRTGEALLIDTRTWQVVYRGPVDDRLYYEFTKEGAQQHFLRDAIEALLDGRAVGLAAPSAIGCRVSLHNQKDVSVWPLGEPDLVIDVPEQRIPAYGVIEYRYLNSPVPFYRDVWVRAVHLRPSSRAVMHHALAFIGYRPESEESFFAAYGEGF